MRQAMGIGPGEDAGVPDVSSSVPNLNSKDFQDCSWYGTALQAIQEGQINLNWFSPSCSTGFTPSPNLTLTQASGSIATKVGSALTTAATGTAAAVLGPLTLGISALTSIVSLIFAHHAAAVKAEQQAGCASLAGVNNTMLAIQEGVQTGQITPQGAIAALQQMYTSYMALLNQYKVWGTSPFCNANCEMSIIVQAMVIYWSGQYQAMAAAAATNPAGAVGVTASNAVASLAASTSLPAWLFYALGAFALYEFVA